MPWLYRLQTRAGLAGPEGTAAVVLVLALAAGLAAQRFQAAEAPVAPDFYAAADAAFVATSADASPAEAPAAEALPAEAPAAEAPPVPPAEAAATVAEATAIVAASAGRSSGRKPPPVATNVNTASAEQLQRLPRIGPALAGRIIEYRQQHGRFQSAAELVEVKGIGEKTLEKLAPYVFV